MAVPDGPYANRMRKRSKLPKENGASYLKKCGSKNLLRHMVHEVEHSRV